MKGIYKTKEGSKVEIVDFDEANKIAMIKLDNLQNKWVDESEYSTWEKEEINMEEVPDEIFDEVEERLPAEIIHEEAIQERPKRTRKKKDQ